MQTVMTTMKWSMLGNPTRQESSDQLRVCFADVCLYYQTSLLRMQLFKQQLD